MPAAPCPDGSASCLRKQAARQPAASFAVGDPEQVLSIVSGLIEFGLDMWRRQEQAAVAHAVGITAENALLFSIENISLAGRYWTPRGWRLACVNELPGVWRRVKSRAWQGWSTGIITAAPSGDRSGRRTKAHAPQKCPAPNHFTHHFAPQQLLLPPKRLRSHDFCFRDGILTVLATIFQLYKILA